MMKEIHFQPSQANQNKDNQIERTDLNLNTSLNNHEKLMFSFVKLIFLVRI